ncbi:MAG TPA: DUF29 domain-containing protein [Acetobacteraceae bacterium]|nr:DUF29 domain-containing protein [Acetobacteraceae bacterium]
MADDPLASAPQRTSDPAYDIDFCAWATAQAKLLRAGRLAEADIAHIAEEIEDLAKRDRRELASRIRTVIEHQMKLAASPATEPHAGWKATINRERVEIGRLLEDSPSLRAALPDIIAREVRTARRLVAQDMSLRGEAPMVRLDALVCSVDQVLGDVVLSR